jgi:hypothetical protein
MQPQYSDVGLDFFIVKNLVHINEFVDEALVLGTRFSLGQRSSPSQCFATCILI